MPISFPDTNPETYFQVFDDFVYPASATASDVMTWTSIDDSGTGTNAFQDVAGGYYNIVTAAADNDYHAMRSVNKVFVFAAGKPIWIDCRFKVSEATLLESTLWIGLNDTYTTGGFQANTSGPIASFTPRSALLGRHILDRTALLQRHVVGTGADAAVHRRHDRHVPDCRHQGRPDRCGRDPADRLHPGDADSVTIAKG
jgi:hypothetical protein